MIGVHTFEKVATEATGTGIEVDVYVICYVHIWKRIFPGESAQNSKTGSLSIGSATL